MSTKASWIDNLRTMYSDLPDRDILIKQAFKEMTYAKAKRFLIEEYDRFCKARNDERRSRRLDFFLPLK